MQKKHRKLKIFLRIIFTIVCLILVYISLYSIKYQLPSKAKNAKELDYSLTSERTFLTQENYAIQRESSDAFVNNFEEENYLMIGEACMCYSKYIVENPVASIVISHGYTECKDKYKEMIYYYLLDNYNVFIMDHRGHGKSQREVDDLSLVYIDSMHTYAADLAYFIANVVAPSSEGLDIILFGHSMGGGIATMVAEDYPDIIDLLILSAPMIQADLGMPEFIASPFAKMMKLFGNSKKYAVGNGPYDEEYEYELEESATSCEERGLFATFGYSNYYNQLWGPSYAWVNAVISGTHYIQRNSSIKKIQVPILLFQAKQDSLVKPNGQNKLANTAKNITMYKVNTKHEIWNATDDIIVPYYNTIFNFIEENI